MLRVAVGNRRGVTVTVVVSSLSRSCFAPHAVVSGVGGSNSFDSDEVDVGRERPRVREDKEEEEVVTCEGGDEVGVVVLEGVREGEGDGVGDGGGFGRPVLVLVLGPEYRKDLGDIMVPDCWDGAWLQAQAQAVPVPSSRAPRHQRHRGPAVVVKSRVPGLPVRKGNAASGRGVPACCGAANQHAPVSVYGGKSGSCLAARDVGWRNRMRCAARVRAEAPRDVEIMAMRRR